MKKIVLLVAAALNGTCSSACYQIKSVRSESYGI